MMLRMPNILTASSQASSRSAVTRIGHTILAVCLPPLSGMAGLDRLAEVANQAVERFILGHRNMAGPRQIDDKVIDDRCRPATHDKNAIGQECRFADAVSDENHGLPIGLPDAQQLDPHFVA